MVMPLFSAGSCGVYVVSSVISSLPIGLLVLLLPFLPVPPSAGLFPAKELGELVYERDCEIVYNLGKLEE